MRRSVLTSVALLSAFLTTGCEDGPNQPFGAAPSGAAGNWNNAGPDAGTSGTATQQYDSGGGGTNTVNVCTAAQQAAAWQTAFNAPIVPPFGVGGVDMSAKGTFAPVTLEDVIAGSNGQGQLCQGASAGLCADGTGFPAYSWGPGLQIYSCFDPASHSLTFVELSPGYSGTLSFTLPKTYNGQPVPRAVDSTGAPADLNFVWEIGKPMTVNGQTLTGVNGGPLFNPNGMDLQVENQMYLGLMYTFQPTLIAVTDATKSPPLTEMTDPTSDCTVTTKCRTDLFGQDGNFGVRAVGVYFDALQALSTDPATASTPGDIYMYPVKFEPYSLAPYNSGLDGFVSKSSDPNLLFNGSPIYGPYAPAGVLSPPGGTETPFCTIYMGATWGDFTKACVNVTGDSKLDATSMAKLLGAQHHSPEWFTFSVVGTNQNFNADTAELTQNGQPGVLQDNVTAPANDCVAADFHVDVRSSGFKLNDMRGDQYPASAAVTALDKFEDSALVGQDLHGSSAVFGYFRILVYNALRAQMQAFGVTPVTDPTKCWFDSSPYTTAAAANIALNSWIAPTGCTGFETMLTAAIPPAGDTDWTATLDVTPQGYHPASVFQPGDPTLRFMADPVNGFGENHYVVADSLFQAALSEVTAIMGRGNVNALPPQARDWRFYFQYWAQAFSKYLLNRSKNPTWQQLYADDALKVHTLRQVNQDNLFFDLNAGGIDKFEYVDRDPAQSLGAPVDFEYDILLNASNTQDMNYYQRLTRAESALYTSMLLDKKAVPGSNENVNVSDLFGSPAIANAGLSAPAADAMGNPVPGCPSCPGGFKDAWYCATTVPQDPDCSNGAPTDQAGNMLVDGEGRPLFTNYHGVFASTAFTIGSTIPITTQLPFIASAIVALPNYASPYDSSSMNTPINVLVPWVPYQVGEGFDIPINGQRNQFIETGSLDFSGVTITTNVDYLPSYDATTGDLNGGVVAAVETQDFLGEVFPCVDGNTGDILRVKMYSSVLDIVNWLETHPGAQAACNVYIKYSPYNNYPDTVTALANGVQLNVNPGAGGGPGRIGDVTLFNASLLTQTQ